VLAPTPFAHQVNIRLQQCCVVLVGVYPATPVVCWRFRCFLPGSLLGTTGHTARLPPGLGVGVLCCHRLDRGAPLRTVCSIDVELLRPQLCKKISRRVIKPLAETVRPLPVCQSTVVRRVPTATTSQ